MLLRWLWRPSVYETPPLRSVPSARKLRDQQHHPRPTAGARPETYNNNTDPVGQSISGAASDANGTAKGRAAHASPSSWDRSSGARSPAPASGSGDGLARQRAPPSYPQGEVASPAAGEGRRRGSLVARIGHQAAQHLFPPSTADTSSTMDIDSEDVDADDEECTEIHCDATFRGGRVHFFRQIPMFFFLLEMFLAFTGMCLAQTTIESVMAPFRMFWRRFRLRDVLATFYVLCGVASLHLVTPSDSRLYSSVYHTIRASSTIKLYVIFNMLELADKLLSAFNTDIIETTWVLIRSRRGPPRQCGGGRKGSQCASNQCTSECPLCSANAPFAEPRGRLFEIALMLAVSAVTVMLHTIVLLCHVATINVAVNSEGSSLVGLLISNNFVEVKSVVFKKNTAESLLSVICQDAVERVQHVIFIIAMLMQHVLTSEGPGSLELGQIALIVFCEVAIDFLKHIFVARFNTIKLELYKTFLHTCFLDVSLRRFLAATKLPVVTSYTSGRTDLMTCPTTHDLSHAHFIPNPAHRAAFVPFPYASLLLWASWPAASAIASTSPFVAVICLILLLSINAFLKTLTFSLASAYTYSIIRKEQRPHPQPFAPPPPPPLRASSEDDGAADAHTNGVSNTPPAGEGPSAHAAAPRDDAGAACSLSPLPRMYVVLDAHIQSLLSVDRFDLQAGKKKK